MQHSARKQISIYHYYCDMFCHACWGVVSWEWLQLRGSVWSKSCICSSTTAWRHNVIKPIWVFRQWHFHRQSSQAHRWRNQKLFFGNLWSRVSLTKDKTEGKSSCELSWAWFCNEVKSSPLHFTSWHSKFIPDFATVDESFHATLSVYRTGVQMDWRLSLQRLTAESSALAPYDPTFTRLQTHSHSHPRIMLSNNNADCFAFHIMILCTTLGNKICLQIDMVYL